MNKTSAGVISTVTRLCLLVLALISTTLTISCSNDEMLVGEWQSEKPERVWLKFTKDSVDESFYNSVSYTRDGQTYTAQWQVAHDGAILFTAPRPLIPSIGFRGNAQPHRILELTRNKFVVKWRGDDPYEFRRIR